MHSGNYNIYTVLVFLFCMEESLQDSEDYRLFAIIIFILPNRKENDYSYIRKKIPKCKTNLPG